MPQMPVLELPMSTLILYSDHLGLFVCRMQKKIVKKRELNRVHEIVRRLVYLDNIKHGASRIDRALTLFPR